MDEEISEDYERTLCQLPSCHVFKIPTRRSAEGYRASDWPKDAVWTGKLKIIAKGRQADILLLDEKNSLFAKCPVTEGAVERTLDSGRYFVLRIQNNLGKHAYIGVAFNERNDAFDFNVALQEHKSECEREDKANSEEMITSSLRDLSLKQGEKIKINIGGSSAGGTKREKKQPPSTSSGGFLAPPPGSSKLPPPKTYSSSRSTPTNSSNGCDLLGVTSDIFVVSSTSPAIPSSSSTAPSSFGQSFDEFMSAPSNTSTTSHNHSIADPFGGAFSNQTVFQFPNTPSSSAGPNLPVFPTTTSTTTTTTRSDAFGSSSSALSVDPFGFPATPAFSSSSSSSTMNSNSSMTPNSSTGGGTTNNVLTTKKSEEGGLVDNLLDFFS